MPLINSLTVSMSFWWNAVALPIIGFMRHANYPEDAVESYILFLRNEILPLLGPCTVPPYPSWMTDDHTPLEFSLILGKKAKYSVRFAIEPVSLVEGCSITALRHTLERLSFPMVMNPRSDLEWFDICAEEFLLPESHGRPKHEHPVSEMFIGFDCADYSATAKVYFMPRIRSLVTKETPEEMMKRATYRMGLENPWTAVSQFLSRFLVGDRPEIEIASIDCLPGVKNRLKIYFRTDILSYSHMEYFITLGGTLSTASISTGLHNARLMWDAMTKVDLAANTLPTQSSYFPAAVIYYELRQGDDIPSSKVYLPVQKYLPNDFEISKGVGCLAASLSGSSITNPSSYPDFIQTMFPHRDLSTRTGIHTYVGCTVKPGGGSDVSVYYSPEAFAPERSTSL
ncbi:tryptophan dimethylallyltransferase-domain-containing protein [Mycena epipterygia]|nr:tryptophan dimethylallyltransferase-domain-containing protein [Mycena epipterygia]